MNVLEHIADDRAVLAHLFRVLPMDTRLVFLVPFNPRLTSEFDRQVGHFRRYYTGELEAKMTEAGFVVERSSTSTRWECSPGGLAIGFAVSGP
jgi:hypothetical protein